VDVTIILWPQYIFLSCGSAQGHKNSELMSHEAAVPGLIIMGMWGAVVGLTMLHDWARQKYWTGTPRYVNKDRWQSRMEVRDSAIWKERQEKARAITQGKQGTKSLE
jgi:hypothetical protein